MPYCADRNRDGVLGDYREYIFKDQRGVNPGYVRVGYAWQKRRNSLYIYSPNYGNFLQKKSEHLQKAVEEYVKEMERIVDEVAARKVYPQLVAAAIRRCRGEPEQLIVVPEFEAPEPRDGAELVFRGIGNYWKKGDLSEEPYGVIAPGQRFLRQGRVEYFFEECVGDKWKMKEHRYDQEFTIGQLAEFNDRIGRELLRIMKELEPMAQAKAEAYFIFQQQLIKLEKTANEFVLLINKANNGTNEDLKAFINLELESLRNDFQYEYIDLYLEIKGSDKPMSIKNGAKEWIDRYADRVIGSYTALSEQHPILLKTSKKYLDGRHVPVYKVPDYDRGVIRGAENPSQLVIKRDNVTSKGVAAGDDLEFMLLRETKPLLAGADERKRKIVCDYVKSVVHPEVIQNPLFVKFDVTGRPKELCGEEDPIFVTFDTYDRLVGHIKGNVLFLLNPDEFTGITCKQRYQYSSGNMFLTNSYNGLWDAIDKIGCRLGTPDGTDAEKVSTVVFNYITVNYCRERIDEWTKRNIDSVENGCCIKRPQADAKIANIRSNIATYKQILLNKTYKRACEIISQNQYNLDQLAKDAYSYVAMYMRSGVVLPKESSSASPSYRGSLYTKLMDELNLDKINRDVCTLMTGKINGKPCRNANLAELCQRDTPESRLAVNEVGQQIPIEVTTAGIGAAPVL